MKIGYNIRKMGLNGAKAQSSEVEGSRGKWSPDETLEWSRNPSQSARTLAYEWLTTGLDSNGRHF